MSVCESKRLEATLLDVLIRSRSEMLAIALRILHCPHLAEDVVQEAAAKASQIDSGATIASPERFARRMVRNLAIDHVRRRGLEWRLLAPESAGVEIEAPCSNPCGQLEVCDALRIVFAALDELPPRTRHVFERNRLQGITQKEIARELNVSATLVNFIVQQAHDHCLARLRALEGDDHRPARAD